MAESKTMKHRYHDWVPGNNNRLFILVKNAHLFQIPTPQTRSDPLRKGSNQLFAWNLQQHRKSTQFLSLSKLLSSYSVLFGHIRIKSSTFRLTWAVLPAHSSLILMARITRWTEHFTKLMNWSIDKPLVTDLNLVFLYSFNSDICHQRK